MGFIALKNKLFCAAVYRIMSGLHSNGQKEEILVKFNASSASLPRVSKPNRELVKLIEG